MMKRLLILMMIMVLPVSSFAVQQSINHGFGTYWGVVGDLGEAPTYLQIDENFAELYGLDSFGISSADISNWNTEADPIWTSSDAFGISTADIAGWDALITNATHTGDVSGSGALTLESVAISGQDTVTAVSTDYVIIGDTSDAGNLKKALVSDFASAGGDMSAATYDPAGIEEQVVGLTATQTLINKTLNSVGINLAADEGNLMWDTGVSYKTHLDSIFEPVDATILKDADIGVTVASENGDVNTIEFAYSDVSATETGKNLRIPTGSTWVNAYSWCDGAEAVLVYDLQYSATLGGAFGSLGTIAHDAAATTDTVDISAFTAVAAGSWVHVDIQTAGTTATVCTLVLDLVNN